MVIEMISAERIREVLDYDAGTGVFMRNGQVAGAFGRDGYRQIRVDGRIYWAHRLAWLWAHGEWPESEIDHVNGDRADNRISNLRAVTSSQNKMNSAIRSDNSSGVKGVSYRSDTGKWFAYINAGPGKKRVRLGCYPTLAAAAEARRVAELEMHGEFRRAV